MKPYRIIHLSWKRFQEDRASLLAAAIAFYAIFSMGPFFLVLTSLGDLLLQDGLLRERLLTFLSQNLTADMAEMIENLLLGARGHLKPSLHIVIGFSLLVYAGMRIFVRIQQALHQVFDIDRPDRRLWLHSLNNYLLALGLYFAITVTLLLSVAASAAIDYVDTKLAVLPIVGVFLLRFVDFSITLTLVFIITAVVFKFLPRKTLSWRVVFSGAAVFSVMLALSSELISAYFSLVALKSIYGAFSSLIVLMLWVYFISLMFIFAAQVTHIHSEVLSQKPKPATP